jgi:hypothetical protein
MTTADVRLCHFCTEPIGCILLVVHAASPGSFPFITLVATSSMATLGAESPGNPPGIFLPNIWQALVLEPFAAILDMEHPHCPILAASEGFSRATTSLLNLGYIWRTPGRSFSQLASSSANPWRSNRET